MLTKEVLNEPITTALARRVIFANVEGSDGLAVMQMLIYLDGYHDGNIYFRHKQGNWVHLTSV